MVPGMSDETAAAAGFDRGRDLRGWVVVPVTTLVVAPLVAGSLGLLMVLAGGLGEAPSICAESAENQCEEITLNALGEHVALFGALWSLLWLTPWWRGLRTARIVLAVVAGAVLVLAPLRMV